MTLTSLHKRILSALVLAPVVLVILYFGGWPFFVMIGAALGLCVFEWEKMIRHLPHRQLRRFAGLAYFFLSILAFVAIRESYESGFYLIITLMLAVWASDTAAYFFGKILQGPKMAPRISPKKTWAGLAGAVIGGAAAICAMVLFAPFFGLNIWAGLALGIAIGLAGQAGDLLISVVKRQAGCKDTGHLIPGHGGILDRIDSLLLAAPVYLLFLIAAGM